MANWISRALTRLAEQPSAKVATPLPPDELRAALESAKKLLAQGNLEETRGRLAEVLASNPGNADALAYYGVATYQAGDPEQARDALRRAAKIDPDHLVANKCLAKVCDALGDSYGLEIAAANAMRLAPGDREVLIMYGVARMNRLEVDAAADAFNKAVEIAPTDLTALLYLEALSKRSLRHRRTLERTPKITTARAQAINRLRASYRRGQLDDNGIRHLVTLLAGAQETFPSAVELARQLTARQDFGAGVADELSGIFAIAGDLPNHLRCRKLASEGNPDLPLPRLHLAYAQLMSGVDRWHESWKTIRETERFSNLGVFAGEVPTWTGQRLGKKRILVYQEQGMGDAILALRMVPILALRGVRFDLWVTPPLAGLASSLKGYEKLIRSAGRPDPRALGCDYASTLFGLISALGVGPQELRGNPTVLVPGADRLPEVRSRLRALKGKRVGLAYGGNPVRPDDWFRAVTLSALKPLAALDGISWVNLVIDSRPDKDEVIGMFRMEDPMKEVADFEDTAAIISELDAVIAIDSSVAHLAASLGKPLWALVPTMVDWRWQIGSDTRPWWPNATLLRSPALGIWDSVIVDLAARIRAYRDGNDR
jgi:tetratricopeptide (TPR) repeat protein